MYATTSWISVAFKVPRKECIGLKITPCSITATSCSSDLSLDDGAWKFTGGRYCHNNLSSFSSCAR